VVTVIPLGGDPDPILENLVAQTTTRRLRAAALLAAALSGALVLSACGSSDNSSSTTSAAATTTAASSAATTTAASSSAATSAESSSASSGSGSESAGASSSAAVSKVGTTGPAPEPITDADKAAAIATLKDPSTLTVCTSLPYPPFEADDGSGKIVGFDIDFMDWLAAELGVKTSIIDSPFAGIQSGQAMKSKQCDIAAAAMTITPERAAAIEFSSPYYDASQALIVLTDSGVKSIADLSGKKLGAQTGTTGLAYANAHAAENGYTVVEYEKISDMEQALQAKNIDAGIHDLPALNDYAKQQAGKVAVVQNFDTGEQYGFGAAKDNTALIKVTDYIIAKSLSDGTYATSYAKWIGAVPTS
jgi:polar amino acid transport system substrate-binding protein